VRGFCAYFEWIARGFDTADLTDAKVLLEELK